MAANCIFTVFFFPFALKVRIVRVRERNGTYNFVHLMERGHHVRSRISTF